MLVDFSVKNYLSFKETTTFSMIASSDKTLWDTNVIENAQDTGINLIKTAIIYGHNASGKSNLIKAMNFMADFVQNSTIINTDSAIKVNPFKIDPDCLNKPSEFDIRFIADGTIYNYGFSVDRQRIHQEWLYSFPKTQKRVLFERDNNKNNPFYFGSHFKGEKKVLEKLTRDDSLFLTVASGYNNTAARAIHSHISTLSSNIVIYSVFNRLIGLSAMHTTFISQEVPDIQNSIKSFVLNADTGIVDIISPKEKLSIENIENKSKAFVNDFKSDENNLNVFPDNDFVSFSSGIGVKYPKTLHKTKNQKGNIVETEFDFSEESDGTKMWYGLAGPINNTLYNGDIAVLDEFDIKLHPLLSKELISMFHNVKTNPKNSQFIGTTHNTDLLDKDLLRRDQIWFTEKKQDTGATDLYSLWDFKKKPRKEEDYRKNYLAGRYGAVPILEKFES